jgi:hypothetical protein
VDESDALLLEHVLWQRPQDAPRIREFVLQWMSRRAALPQQAGFLLDGLSQRAARPGRDALECKGMAAEAVNLRKVCTTRAARASAVAACADST